MEIEIILSERINAIKNRDVDKAIEAYSTDVVSYDVVGELKYTGIAALRQRLEEWLSTLSEINDYEITDVKSSISQNMAFCSSLNHINAIIENGKLDMWWRETICLAKTDGVLKITHTHSSVPFDAETGMASVGLKPHMKEKEIQPIRAKKSPAELVRRLFLAFQNQEREVIEDILHPDFIFSSPHDPKLNKAQYFELCFPFSEKVTAFELLKFMENGNEVFVMYKCSSEGMADFVNTEYFTVENGKIKSVKVFFGDN